MIEPSPDEGEDGFTLIEVLVAFAIVSLCLASLYAAMGDHARHMATTDLHRQTLAYARTHLEIFGEALPAQVSPVTGSYPNGTKWRLSVRAITIGGDTTDIPLPMRPFFIDLQAFDYSGHSIVTLYSIKMFPVER